MIASLFLRFRTFSWLPPALNFLAMICDLTVLRHCTDDISCYYSRRRPSGVNLIRLRRAWMKDTYESPVAVITTWCLTLTTHSIWRQFEGPVFTPFSPRTPFLPISFAPPCDATRPQLSLGCPTCPRFVSPGFPVKR